MASYDARLDPVAWGGQDAQTLTIGNAVLPLFNQNRAGIVSSLRYGDQVKLYQQNDDWSLLAGVHDGYLGWAKGLIAGSAPSTSQKRVTTLATHIYPEANMKTPPLMRLSLGSWLNIEGEEGDFYRTNLGFVFKAHLEPEGDAVDFAACLLDVPYLWGGGSADGIDCSGLTQLCHSMTGASLPRDTDQQEAALKPISRDEATRGDLVYWKGHVGILQDDATMIHATAFAMKTIRENLDEAIARIGKASSFRRVT